jgi:hypothetical protein
MPEPRQLLGSLLPDGVPPGSEIQALPAILRRPCARADRPAPGRGPSGRQAGNSCSCTRSRTVRPCVADRPRLTREHLLLTPGRGPSGPVPRTVRAWSESTAAGSFEVIDASKKVSTYFLKSMLTLFPSAKYSRRTSGGALWSGADGPRPGAGRSATWRKG